MKSALFVDFDNVFSQQRHDHGSCVVSMLKVVGIARSLGILVVGRLVPAPVLRELEAGRIFATQAQACSEKLWYPEDMASAVAHSAAF